MSASKTSDTPLLYTEMWDTRSLFYAIVGAVLFGAMAYVSIEFTRGDDRLAAVWLPNALAVAFLLRARLPREDMFLVGLWIGNFFANTLIGDSPLRAASLSAANSAEILAAVLLMRRYCSFHPDMQNIRHLVSFVLFAGICAPSISATIAFGVLSIQGPTPLSVWLEWMFTDGLGMILAAPIAMIFADAWQQRRKPTRQELLDWSLMTTIGTAVTIFVFAQTQYPLLFLVAPVVISHAFKLSSLGTAFSMVKVAVISTAFTWMGSGPIHLVDGSLTAELLTLQAFLATAFFVGLPVAAILNGRDAMTREIIARREELDTLAHSITDAVLRYDVDGVCTYASPSVDDVLKRPRAFYIGRPASQETHPEAEGTIIEAERRLVTGETQKERITYRRLEDDENDQPVYIEADCAATFDRTTGERTGIIVSARDVTERVRLQSDLVRARKHAEQAAEAKSTFLANMSHEIRTPMNGVLGFAELLLQGKLESEQKRQAEMIYDSGRSMMLLLNDILDLSKIEAGQIVINQEAVDLHHLLRGCTKLHTAYAQQKGISLEYRECNTLHRHIVSDQLRLRQIVLNLVGNAVKFTEHGRVEVSTSTANEQLSIIVSDTGIGIPDDRQHLIFNPFQQADGATSRKHGGTGLGLSISRQLAGLLGGTLSCTSTPGKGSRFVLTIPLELADNTPVTADQNDPFMPTSHVLQPARILLAEDHDINRILASTMLERCRQEVEIACDGEEAIAMVLAAKEQGTPYDLVLMDIQMPGLDGYSAAREIRSRGIAAKDLPIVALTANAFAEDVAAARDAGMQAHLAKPLVYAELMATLRQWLPAKILEEGQVRRSLAEDHDMPEAHNVQPRVEQADNSNDPASCPTIRSRWLERREEAISAVETALKQNSFASDDREDLARVIHKLAGTAGVFGEAELGAKATALERALKSEQPEAVAIELATELLQTALQEA